MLKFKNGVKMAVLSPQMVLAVQVIADIFQYPFGKDCVITSITDGRHMKGSKHGTGEGMDFRISHVDEDNWPTLVTLIKTSLTADFDVVLEKDHIHVEYDPK